MNGNNKTISISKIIKIKATKKNFKQKGARLFSRVWNPHSKGLKACLSNLFFFPKTQPSLITKILSNSENNKINSVFKILFLKIEKINSLNYFQNNF